MEEIDLIYSEYSELTDDEICKQFLAENKKRMLA